ncbi:hypothetical protein [Nocardia vaccinii]|uniref:hypothetical protein n=1 Tax=Nocardia vaccinii TaxID=1822 RepID=UPI000AD853E9|nr:hypothetical protein [Nocardia vaccinii]
MSAVPPEQQKAFDAAIGQQVLREMYEEDSRAALKVELHDKRIGVSLASDTQSAIIPPGELIQAIADMVTAHERASTGFTDVTYEYVKDAQGQWTMVAHFSYAD